MHGLYCRYLFIRSKTKILNQQSIMAHHTINTVCQDEVLSVLKGSLINLL